MIATTRRSFVRKSLATTVSISFTGLIRAAHGATTLPLDSTGPDTTIDPWTDATTEPIGSTIELTGITDFTIPTDYTIDQWSFWSIDPVTDPPTDEGDEFTLIPCNLRNPPVEHDWADFGQYGHKCTKCGQEYQLPTP